MHTHVSSVAKIRTRTLTLLGCLPLLVACPEDPTGGGGGETGGDSDPPEAIDPLDGEGSNPPGNPDPALVWRVPSNHGNGLAHDSRYDLQADSYTKSLSEPALSQGVDWADFVQSHDDKVRRGFRPTHVDAKVALATKGGLTFELKITDRSVYVSDDDANYRTETKTYVFKNTRDERLTLTAEGPSDPGEPRPISIDTFSIPNGPNLTLPRVGHTIVWVYDDDPVPWQLVVGQEVENFEQTLTALSSQGYRPISLASRYRAGTSEYSAIFVADGMPATDWKVMIGSNWVDLLDNLDSLWQSGFYPFRGTYEHHSEHLPTFNVLWTKRSPQLKLELRYNMDETLFNEQDRHWRQQGYYLENSCAYSDGGNTRYAGLWMRHEPYLRYEDGIPVDVASQAYLNKYEPFHTAAIQAMTMAGTDNEGEFFRPSATLYILDQGVPVLNRAYTYAPGIYPDTPVNAPMALASVAKSITAAAVVHVLDDKNIPLTAPFAGTAGINNVPSMATVPTVADVLRNLGGFRARPESYLNHSLIDASPWGQYPISGQMMYDYVVSGGKLGIPTDDNYWDLALYNMTQFEYSNPGFIYNARRTRSRAIWVDLPRLRRGAPPGPPQHHS